MSGTMRLSSRVVRFADQTWTTEHAIKVIIQATFLLIDILCTGLGLASRFYCIEILI